MIRWRLADGGDPYALAAAAVGRYSRRRSRACRRSPAAPSGFFGYDLVRTVEPLGEPGPDELGLPDMALMLSDLLVVFDNLKHTVTILVNVYADEDPRAPTPRRARRSRTSARAWPGRCRPSHRGRRARSADFRSNMTRASFESMVARIVEYIHAGDAFQVVPSQRWSAPVEVDAFSIYRGLRAVNPSPYMYFLDFGDFQVAGASPEPLITVVGRQVTTRPIAGTRPRGADAAQDARLEAELLEDEKERAEHMMLVDLGRNDLGRVCEYGSVKVKTLMAVEHYSHVMHLVSSVTGRLRAGVGAMDALRPTLPAGTLSGAPKVRAMQIIDELEPVKRGGYGGAIGYLSYTRRAGHRDPHPHGRRQGRRRPRAGRRRHGRRRHCRSASSSSRSPRRRRSCGRSSSPVSRATGSRREARRSDAQPPRMATLARARARDRQLRLLHLQPRAVPRRARRRRWRSCATTARASMSCSSARPSASSSRPARARPTEAGITLEVVRRFPQAGIPTLGVCLGHQALAQAFGGAVVRHLPVHGKTGVIEHDGRTSTAACPRRSRSAATTR